MPLDLRQGDRLLLTSDGLTDLVDERDIEDLLRDQDVDAVAVETPVAPPWPPVDATTSRAWWRPSSR